MLAAGSPTHGAATGGLFEQLRYHRPTLPRSLRDVAAYIVEHPELVTRATISELASTTGTSVGTVNRLCHALGLRGYTDLRLAVATEVGRGDQTSKDIDLGVEIGPDTPFELVASTLAAVDSRAMQATAARVDPATVDRIATVLLSAQRIEVFGIGGSAIAAEELVFRLRRLGVPAWSSTEVHAGLTSLALLGPEDVVVVITHSGRTVEALDMLDAASAGRTPTVALTNVTDSPAASRADLVMTTTVAESGLRSEALAARHSQLLLIDLLFVAVAQRGGDDVARALRVTTAAVAGRLTDVEPTSRPKRRRRSTSPP